MQETNDESRYDDSVNRVSPTEANPFGYTKRQLMCVGLPCPYCGKEMLYEGQRSKRMPTRDHFFAKSTHRHLYMMGDDSPCTVMVCQGCNMSKSNHTFEAWTLRNKNSERWKRLFPLAEHIMDGVVRVMTLAEMHRAIAHGDDPRGFLNYGMVESIGSASVPDGPKILKKAKRTLRKAANAVSRIPKAYAIPSLAVEMALR